MTRFPSLVYENGMHNVKFWISNIQHSSQKIMRRSRKCKVTSVLFLVEESIQKQDRGPRNTTTGHLWTTQGRQVALSRDGSSLDNSDDIIVWRT
jgi:hypothetical protein